VASGIINIEYHPLCFRAELQDYIELQAITHTKIQTCRAVHMHYAMHQYTAGYAMAYNTNEILVPAFIRSFDLFHSSFRAIPVFSFLR